MALGVGRIMTIKPDNVSGDGLSARRLETKLLCETFQIRDNPQPVFEP
jgi:hypothetical protein